MSCLWSPAPTRIRRVAQSVILSVLVLALGACGNDGEPTDSPANPSVVQETVTVPGSIPPPDADTAAETASALNRATAQTHRAAGGNSAEIEKVLVLMPGFLGGAGDFDYLARRVVERSAG